jgi:hypothetical protein
MAALKTAYAAIMLALCTGSAPAEPDAIAAAAKGLKAVIEDDLRPGGDMRLLSIQTKGCKTKLTAKGRRWNVDWSTAEELGLADSFIFVKAKGVQFAIVADASIPDQAAKLTALNDAMQAAKARCASS